MMAHPRLRIGLIDPSPEQSAVSLANAFNRMAHVQVECFSKPPGDLNGFDAVITAGVDPDITSLDGLLDFARAGHAWLMLVAPGQDAMPAPFGASLSGTDPAVELRVLFQQRDHTLAAGLPDAVYLPGHHRKLTPRDDQTEVILYADWQYDHSPVLVRCPLGAGSLAATVIQAHDHPFVQRVLYRLLYQDKRPALPDREIGVGLLGYAPSVGQLHGLGSNAIPGLNLQAVCDLDPGRRDQARTDFGDVRLHDDAARLAADDKVDLVIVATPPNSHSPLAIQMLEAGKHVVCEKPLALSRRETDAMAAKAAEVQRLLCCHQNRRFDSDYLAIKQALDQGRIGQLFHAETFVGGFHHPCGYWHSHAPVSGGTTFDWGAHYLDWIVGLMGRRVSSVQGWRHNRVWHDVTNADQERILVRFDDGAEAEFIHSDIAAARKPKWYLLGTRGAIVGQWHDVTTHMPDPVHYFQPHEIPATEMPPQLTLHRRQGGGAVVRQEMALPARETYAFHQNLADHLFWGEPLAAPPDDSAMVVAILEAAARSMVNGGASEVVHG